MNVLKAFKRLKPIGIWKLFKLCFANILFIFPTLSATKKCMRIATEHYQKKHYLNGRANAFRHALWNYMIAKKCTKWSKNPDNIIRWTKNITDWHEFAFPNRALAKKTDFHNNEVGRSLFLNHSDEPLENIILILKKKTGKSLLIHPNTDLKSVKGRLVHIMKY